MDILKKSEYNIAQLSGLICKHIEPIMKGNRDEKKIGELINDIVLFEVELKTLKKYLEREFLN